VRAIQVTELGGPEVLNLVETASPQAGPGQVLIDVDSAGINYGDTLMLDDSYPGARTVLPMIPGGEIVGRTADGRRVVAATGNSGGYAEQAVANEALVHEIPEGITDDQALALAAQGLTAWHLLRTAARLGPGESLVVPAAAGGVGSLVVQLAKLFGAGRVIGIASSKEKRDLVLELGADAVVTAEAEGLTERLIEANDGKMFDVVLEMTGGEVFAASLEAVAPFGRLVCYGAASKVPPPPVDVAKQLVNQLRSIIGFYVFGCLRRPGTFHEPLDEMLAMTVDGRLKPQTGGVYPLADARRAHEDLRARRTYGKLVLDVSGWSQKAPTED
jgi:NADPH:quinone reductase